MEEYGRNRRAGAEYEQLWRNSMSQQEKGFVSASASGRNRLNSAGPSDPVHRYQENVLCDVISCSLLCGGVIRVMI
jgi:hypothetical protein